MHPMELQSGVFLRRSPFLVVKQLDDNEVRFRLLYSHINSKLLLSKVRDLRLAGRKKVEKLGGQWRNFDPT